MFPSLSVGSKLQQDGWEKAGMFRGGDCPIEEVELVKHNGRWYGPIRLVFPTQQDNQKQERINTRKAAIQKAKDAGLTDEELEALMGQ